MNSTIVILICLVFFVLGVALEREVLHKCVPAYTFTNREPEFDDFLRAIVWVESKGNEIAIGANGERGLYQLSEIYIDDVNRILGPSLAYGKDVYSYKGAFNPTYSKTMVKCYLKYYLDKFAKDKPESMSSFEMAARIHNDGPNGWKKDSTKPYWEKIKARMESQ